MKTFIYEKTLTFIEEKIKRLPEGQPLENITQGKLP